MTIYSEFSIQETGNDVLTLQAEFKDTASRIPYPYPEAQTGIPVSATFTQRYVPTEQWRASLVPSVSGASLSIVGGSLTDMGPIDLVTWTLPGGVIAKGGLHYLEDACVVLMFNRS